VVRDMTEQHPDFQYPFRPGIEPGIVGPQLDARDKPVYVGGTSGTRTTKGPESFASWFNDVPGINERGRLELRLQVHADRPGRFILEERPFFPIDGQLAGNEGRAHNWHFTIEATTSITYRGGETLSLAADDDLWVFVDRRLVGDLGGTHRDDEVVTVSLDRLGLAPGRTYPMHLFYAERHTVGAALYVDLADHLLECP
jgi:fibro-slime domain-containing protein